MNYKLQQDNENNVTSIQVTKDDGTVWSIPLDENNKDYQEYIEWTKLSPANVAAPADE